MKNPLYPTAPSLVCRIRHCLARRLRLGGDAKRGPLASIKVTVTQVAKGEVSPALFGIGTVEARRAYLIGPTAAGRVKRVLVDVGDAVKAGQLLAEMEPVDLDARVSSASAATARARSAIVAAQAQVTDAKSRQALAASEARRFADLGQKGSSARVWWKVNCSNNNRRMPSLQPPNLRWRAHAKIHPRPMPSAKA